MRDADVIDYPNCLTRDDETSWIEGNGKQAAAEAVQDMTARQVVSADPGTKRPALARFERLSIDLGITALAHCTEQYRLAAGQDVGPLVVDLLIHQVSDRYRHSA